MPQKVERNAAIVQMYQNGQSINQIGAALELTRQRVFQILQSQGIVSRPRKLPRPRTFVSPRDQQIIDLYQQGELATAIAPRFSLCPSSVQSILHRHQVAMRPPGVGISRQRHENEDRAVILYGEGKSLISVGALVGLSPMTVYHILQDRGIPRRSSGYRNT